MTQIRFGPFVLDASATRLVRDGAEVKLRPQAFQALKVLALHSGHYVGHDRLIAEAWDGVLVSRHTIDVTLGEVRRTLKEYGKWIAHRSRVGYCLEVPRSETLVRRGRHYLSLRSREGLEKALACFQQAALDGPTDFRAHEGQSVCYLLLASQGMRAPRAMYAQFLAAHGRAEALAGLTPELRCNRAHGRHLFERRLAEAEADFHQVIMERPTLGSAYVRMSMLYVTMGRLDEAVEYVERAYTVAPLLPLVPATEAFVRFWRREFDLAVDAGAKAVELHPYLQLGRVFYAQALEFSGRLDEALTQYHLGTVMSQDPSWILALEGACLVKAGRRADAVAILERLERLREREYVDAYGMAVLRGALGQSDRAFVELDRACDENCAGLFAMDVDPKLDCFRSDPRFAGLRTKTWDCCEGVGAG